MSNDANAELIGAYLDHELEGEAAEQFEELLESSPTVRQEVEDLERVLGLVSGLGEVEAPPDFYENLAVKMRRRRPAPQTLLWALVSLPFQVLSIIVILVIAATYLMIELDRDAGRLEKDPAAAEAAAEAETGENALESPPLEP